MHNTIPIEDIPGAVKSAYCISISSPPPDPPPPLLKNTHHVLVDVEARLARLPRPAAGHVLDRAPHHDLAPRRVQPHTAAGLGWGGRCQLSSSGSITHCAGAALLTRPQPSETARLPPAPRRGPAHLHRRRVAFIASARLRSERVWYSSVPQLRSTRAQVTPACSSCTSVCTSWHCGPIVMTTLLPAPARTSKSCTGVVTSCMSTSRKTWALAICCLRGRGGGGVGRAGVADTVVVGGGGGGRRQPGSSALREGRSTTLQRCPDTPPRT